MAIKQLFPCALIMILLASCAPAATDQVEVVPVPEETEPITIEMETEREFAPFSLGYYAEYTLDPAQTQQRPNLNLAGLLYEGLFQLDQNFVAQPLLCQSYTTSGDGLVWNFLIREDVTFSDGTPLTAALVASSLTASAQEDSRYGTRLSDVTSFEAVDQTLIITLSAPNNRLVTLLDVPITLYDEANPLTPLGTGQYVLDSAQECLRLRENYWRTDSQLRVEEIPLYPIRRSDDLVSAFDAGYISLVDVDLLATQAPYFSSSYEIYDYPTSGLVYLGFNVGATGENGSACTSSRLRHVVAMAVDRSAIVTQDFAQHAVASTLPIHPAAPLYDALLAATGECDPSTLTSAVEELPPRDEPLRLLTANENPAKLSAAQRIVDSLNEAGVPAQLVSLPWDDYVLALEEGNFDIYLAETQLTSDFDLAPIIGTAGALNYGGYASVTTDELLNALQSVPASSLSGAATRLYTQILEEMPLVPICFKNGSVLTQWGRVSQLTSTQANPFYQLEQWIFYEKD